MEFGPYLTIGLQLALTVVIFFFLGRWLDEKFGTDPWLMIAGLGIGITGGFIKFFTAAISMGKDADREARKQKESSGGED
jgi:ATP synthase protein I